MIMETTTSNGEPSPRRVVHERVYVAVGSDVEESKSVLLWALDNFDGDFRVLHVHQPEQINTHVGQLSDSDIRARRELERQRIHRTLDAYIHICNQAKVHAEKRYLELRGIGKGIVELVEQHAVTKLVMGAAAERHFYEGMQELKSRKAIFVHEHAHPSCQIWFVCNKHVITIREGDLNAVDLDVTSSSLHACSTIESAQSNQNGHDRNLTIQRSYSSEEDELCTVRCERGETSASRSESNSPPPLENGHHFYNGLEASNSGLYDQFERAVQEAANARTATDEMLRRQKAEKAAVEANCRVRVLKNLLSQEERLRKELEEALVREGEKLGAIIMRQQEELSDAMEQSTLLRSQVEFSDHIIKELNDKVEFLEGIIKELKDRVNHVEELLEHCNKERDELQIELDNSHILTKELNDKVEVNRVEELLENCNKERDELQIELDNTHILTIELNDKVEFSDDVIKELEDRVNRVEELLENCNKERDELHIELDNAHIFTKELNDKVEFSDDIIKELEDRVNRVEELLENCNKERDELQTELDNAHILTKELNDKVEFSDDIIKELEDRVNLVEELLVNCNKERDEKQIELDNAHILTKELNDKVEFSDDVIKELEDRVNRVEELLENCNKERVELQIELENAHILTKELNDKVDFSDDVIKELEDRVNRVGELLENCNKERDELQIELDNAHILTKELNDKVQFSDDVIKELEDRVNRVGELIENCNNERDELQIELDNAHILIEELLRNQDGQASSLISQQFLLPGFSFSEIQEATNNLDPSMKIKDHDYGKIYKGVLRHTQVAIKMLPSDSSGSPSNSQYHQELEVAKKIRHPNLVTLIGVCPDPCNLVYEYLPNGSLEEQLDCRDRETSPLTWQTRLRVATEICAALTFLHSSEPEGIIHGDLKAENVWLDANFVSKLCDYGLSPALSHLQASSNLMVGRRLDLSAEFPHMDPHFLATGELSTMSDVYSLGIILLRLLTGKPAINLPMIVKDAVERGNISNLLDPLARGWPFDMARELIHMALRCCDEDWNNRPDLGSEVLEMLQSMEVGSEISSSFQAAGREDERRPPNSFICPISHDIMEEPLVAADGFSYDAESIRAWIETGHHTSPMTNITLAHLNLVPNFNLRSAIQEWQQMHQIAS